jgi:hypothetical protein
VVARTTGKDAALASVLSVAWAQPVTIVAGTTGEGTALACVRSVGVGSARHSGGGNDRCERCFGLCSIVRRWLRQPLWCRAGQFRALLWTLFVCSARAQPATVLAGTTFEDAALASVMSAGEGSASHWGGGDDR